MVYAGIGSRKTPREVLNEMYNIARILGQHGWTLRSGGADGADAAFEAGAASVDGPRRIYLPWMGFNERCSEEHVSVRDIESHELALSIAEMIHPNWDAVNRGGTSMHARNVCQILGDDLASPAEFVVYWAKEHVGGGIIGGTANRCQSGKGARDPNVQPWPWRTPQRVQVMVERDAGPWGNISP